jgi:alkyl sulfatase BDS1-like metallo-beta-lactamase superfamily hydrolase
MIELPPELDREWYNRGYYGTVSHDAKAVYQRYLGWFDGNPANLHPLPPEDASKRYVEFMGGADALLSRAREAYGKGEYRWVAQVVNHLVFTDPDNREARELEADALEQLGYVAESGPWRNFFLTGARELREGVAKSVTPTGATGDVMSAMSVGMLFDYMAISLNGPKAAGHALTIGFVLTDVSEEYLLTLENGVLNHSAGKWEGPPDATLTTTRASLDKVLGKEASPPDLVAAGELKIEGDPAKLSELFGLMDQYDLYFNIVTP